MTEIPAELVKLATEAVDQHYIRTVRDGIEVCACGSKVDAASSTRSRLWEAHYAEATIAVVLPGIERMVRDQVAAALLAEPTMTNAEMADLGDYCPVCLEGGEVWRRYAARIARGPQGAPTTPTQATGGAERHSETTHRDETVTSELSAPSPGSRIHRFHTGLGPAEDCQRCRDLQAEAAAHLDALGTGELSDLDDSPEAIQRADVIAGNILAARTNQTTPNDLDALRDRIADALTQWAHTIAGGRPGMLLPRDEAIIRENSLARADTVMDVIRPEWEHQRELAEAALKGWKAERERAEQAEYRLKVERSAYDRLVQERDSLNGTVTRLRERAVQAEAALKKEQAGADLLADVIKHLSDTPIPELIEETRCG